MEIDITEEKFISNVMKDGTTCEACMLLKQNDECYFNEQKDPLHQYPTLPYAQAVARGKQLFTEAKYTDFSLDSKLAEVWRVSEEDMACKPGGKLRIRRLNSLEIYAHEQRQTWKDPNKEEK